MIDYTGIDEAVLIHALYHGTSPLGMGVLHNKPKLSVENVKADFGDTFGQPQIYIDYYAGRPLKVRLTALTKTFDERLYDRDAGAGCAARIVARLKTEVST